MAKRGVALAKPTKEEGRRSGGVLPIVALFLILSLGVVSIFSAPLIIDLLKDNVDDFEERVATIEEKEVFKIGERDYSQLDVAVGVSLWIILVAFSMFLVAANLGSSGVEKEDVLLRPTSDNPRAWAKYERKLAKIRRAKMKEVKKLKEKQEREARKRGVK
jgi:hypothetical protein